MRYSLEFLRTLTSHRLGWWVSLGAAYIFQAGVFSDYKAARGRLEPLTALPEEVPLWTFVIPFVLWVAGSLAHRETIRRMRAARLSFETAIQRNVPLFNNVVRDVAGGGSRLERVQVDSFDMAKAIVVNEPYDLESGRDVEDAHTSAKFYDKASGKLVLEFDYPRWSENPKTGYQGTPTDHFPNDWNYRRLRGTGDKNSFDFAIKSVDDEFVYGFRGRSQLRNDWKEPSLTLPKGVYLCVLTVMGKGLRKAGEFRVILENRGAGSQLEVWRTTETVPIAWYGVSDGSR